MDKSKELILHIGRAKTGTSTLQHYLSCHRERLAEQSICYPKTGTNGRVAHHTLAKACGNLRPFNTVLRQLRRSLETEVAPHDRIIISSEAFQNLITTQNLHYLLSDPGAGAAASLRYWLSPFASPMTYEIKVVCYIREYLEQACSSYAQAVHETGFVGSLGDYTAQHFRRPLSSFVRMWRRFSDSALFVYYSREELIERDIVADFLMRTKLPRLAPIEAHDANPSLSGNLLSFKLLLNHHGLHSMDHYNAFSQLAHLEDRYRGRIYISDEQASDLRSRDGSFNAQLSHLVGAIQTQSFADGNRFASEKWAADVERFLEHPTLSHLRQHAAIMHTTAKDMAELPIS